MDLEELILLFNKYKERNIDSESAKKLLEYLISKGYDIGFLDTKGNIRKDPDGRLGYKTLEALNREIAILRGNYPDNYQSDFLFTFGGDPTYNTVVGRSPEDVRNMAHVYYNYYSQHPEMYAGLLHDKKLAATVLPYLSDEAKSLLSKKVEEWAYKNGRTLNIPEMAHQGLLGSRGLELLQQWEQANVRDALTRGLNNIVQVIGGDILGAGLKVMGRLTGGSDNEMGGLTYTTRYNPITRLKLKVAVPNKTATVWSNIPNMNEGYALDELGHPIMLSNGNLVSYKIPQPVKDVTGVVVNTVTDPLTWMMSAGDYVPGQRVTYLTANVPSLGYIDDVMHVTEGVDIWNPTTTVVREPAHYIIGRPVFSITGNRKTGFRGKHGGINNIVSTLLNTYKYIPATTEEVPVINLGIKDVDYLYHKPSLKAYVTERLPSTHKPSFGIWPAIQGTPIEYGNVGFISSLPSGYARFKYLPNGNGRKIVYTDVTDDNQVLEVPTAKTRNIWAKQPLVGLVPQYWMGLYKGGGAVKKRTDGPLDRGELKLRLAWLESKFDPAVVGRKGAVGLFQIMKTALDHFNEKHKGGRLYTMKDMKNLLKNTDVRNWLMDDLENSTMANKEMSGDSISYAKALGGFNWGRGYMSNALVKAKNAGVDIYDSWDWLPYLPQETLSYINFILRGLDVNNKITKATNAEYEKDKADNSTTVNKVLNIGYKK